MLREQRGRILYIPVVVPDNYFIGVAHILGALAAILIFVASFSTSWQTMDIFVPSDNAFQPSLQVIIHFDLRSLHIRYCETYNASTSLGAFSGCGFEDVPYTACSQYNDFCAARGDSTQAFVFLILSGIGMLGVCGVALLRLGLLPTGFMFGSWIVLLSVFSFRQDADSFVPSDIVQAWITAGTMESGTSWGYVIAVVSSPLLALAAVLATIGYIRTAKEDASRRTAEGGNGPATVATEEHGNPNGGGDATVVQSTSSDVAPSLGGGRGGARRSAREAEVDVSYEF